MSLLSSFFNTLVGAPGSSLSAADAAKLVTDDKAILIDVRDPDEWSSTGVATPAKLLPLGDLRGPRKQWKSVLSKVGDRQLILYCASGARSAFAAKILTAEGFKAVNLGGFSTWANANLPTRNVR